MLSNNFEHDAYRLMRSLDVMQYEVQEGLGLTQRGFEKMLQRSPVPLPVLRFANVLDCDVEVRFIPRPTAERRQEISLAMKKELMRTSDELLAPYNIGTGVPPAVWAEINRSEKEIKEKYRAQMPKLMLHKLEDEH